MGLTDDDQQRLAAAELLRQSGYGGPTVNGAAEVNMLSTDSIVIVGAGRLAAAETQSASFLRNQPDIFDLGGALIRVDGNTVLPLDRHSLSHLLGVHVRYVKIKDDKVTTDDPPQRMVDMLLSPGFPRRLRSLNAVITAPTIRLDGSVIDAPGYDAAAGLLYAPDGESPPVPVQPSAAELHQAINDLFHPFHLFPFVSPLDWSIIAAAMLTAVVRPTLPTAPAFAVDAPTQGSGKTLLAKCVATQASGEIPRTLPHVERRDDEEMRKRLFAALRGSHRVIFLDNVTGVFDSPSLAALLTSPRFEDRILGRSETLALPNRSLVLLSANNMTLAGDMPRRTLTMRIDPRCEAPYARQFDFDPLEYVAQYRQRLAVAALTIVRAWLSSGAERAPGRVASFEAWDDLVRQPIAWLARTALSGRLADPIEGFHAGTAADPDREALAALLTALRACFGDGAFTAADVADIVRSYNSRTNPASAEQQAVATALADVAGRGDLSAKSIGRVFNFRRGRIVNRMALQSRPARNVKEWFVALESVS